MTEPDKDPFEGISDEDLIAECQERGIWNEEASLDDYSDDEIDEEMQARYMRDSESESIYHRCREVMRSGNREALWELVRTEVQDRLGVIV